MRELSGKDVGDVSPLFPLDHVGPDVRLVLARPRGFAIGLDERIAYGRSHLLAVSADEDGRPFLKQFCDAGTLGPHPMLDERYVALRPSREGRQYGDDAIAFPGGQFVAIEKIHIRVIDAEEQERGANLPSIGLLYRPLLKKAPKRRYPGSRADQHDGLRCVCGGMETGV